MGVVIVEIANRLVGEDERGIVDEGPGNRDALLLSAAQFGRPVPGAIAETYRVQELLGAPGIRLALRKHGHKDVVESCKLREEVVGLEDEPDALVAIRRSAERDMPVTADPPTIISPQSGRSSAAMRLSSVVLPEPDGPTRSASSPCDSAKDTSRSAVTRLCPRR